MELASLFPTQSLSLLCFFKASALCRQRRSKWRIKKHHHQLASSVGAGVTPRAGFTSNKFNIQLNMRIILKSQLADTLLFSHFGSFYFGECRIHIYFYKHMYIISPVEDEHSNVGRLKLRRSSSSTSRRKVAGEAIWAFSRLKKHYWVHLHTHRFVFQVPEQFDSYIWTRGWNYNSENSSSSLFDGLRSKWLLPCMCIYPSWISLQPLNGPD